MVNAVPSIWIAPCKGLAIFPSVRLQIANGVADEDGDGAGDADGDGEAAALKLTKLKGAAVGPSCTVGNTGGFANGLTLAVVP